MTYLDRFAMKHRCGDCAFTSGTDANSNAITRATADLCVLSGEPFYCHEARPNGTIDARVDPVSGEALLCRGFIDAFVSQGAIDDGRAAAAVEGLAILEELAAGRVVSEEQVIERITSAGERAEAEL